jgi:hypothetical protein
VASDVTGNVRHAGRRGEVVGEIARYLGAVSILLVGVVHAQQYYSAYFSVVPTIGTLSLLSFVGSGIVGVILLAPVRRLGRRIGDLILVLAAYTFVGDKRAGQTAGEGLSNFGADWYALTASGQKVEKSRTSSGGYSSSGGGW